MHMPIWYGISALVWALFLLIVLIIILVALVAIVRGPSALKGLLAPTVRVWMYDVTSAGLMVAVGYGMVSGNLASLWGVAIAAVLRVARANVPAATSTVLAIPAAAPVAPAADSTVATQAAPPAA